MEKRTRSLALDHNVVIRVLPLLSVWFLLNTYAARPVVSALRAGGVVPATGWAVAAILSLLPLVGFIAGRWEKLRGRNALQSIGYLSMGVSSLLLVFSVAGDVVRWLVWMTASLVRAFPEWNAGHLLFVATPAGRSIFLGWVNLSIVGAVAVLALIGLAQARCPRVRRVDIAIDGLPPSLEGFRIAQISDLHVGPTIRSDYVARVVESTNELEPDAVAITGDLVDGFAGELREQVSPLAGLRARDGVFYVTGNHEYYWGAEEWVSVVRELGLVPLLNAHRMIEREGASLAIAGVPDFTGSHLSEAHRPDVFAALAGTSGADATILLAHQPQMAEAARDAGVDLLLSGHTHGGQYFPFNLLIRLFQPVVAGLHRDGPLWLYVNRGTGYWGPPTRLGVPGEITLLRLVAGSH